VKASWLPLLGWMIGSAFFFYAWLLRVSPSVMVEELMRDFAVGGAILGNLSALYFFAYAGLQIPMGVLLDRFGPRRLMTVAALVCGGGALLFALADGVAAANIGRLLIGGGAACSFVGSLSIAARWFPPQRFALFAGITQMLGLAGGMVGQAPVGLAVGEVGWRATSAGMAGFGLLLALAAWFLVPRRPAAAQRGEPAVATALLTGLWAAMGRRQNWLAAFVGMALAAPLLGFAALWGVPFLEAAYALPRATAALLTSLLFAGWGVGAVAMGWMSDRIGRRKAPLLAGIVVALAGSAVLVHVTGLPVPLVALLCFVVGFAGSAQILCFALVRESNALTDVGAALGLLNTMVMAGGVLYQPLIGGLLDGLWDGRLVAGAPVYAPQDYAVALSVMLVALAVGFVAAIGLRETYCRPLP